MNEYEIVIPLLNRAVLARLVTDLGGVADETQMMSDSYRYFLEIFEIFLNTVHRPFDFKRVRG